MALGRGKKESGEWENPYFQQRGWLISAGFLLAMVGLAGVAALSDGGGSAGSSDAAQGRHSASPSTPPSDGASAGAGRPAGCRTDDSDQRKPTKAPADMRWKNVGSQPIPTTPTAGPLKIDGSVWSCFAHTPMGAVIAVHSITQHIPYAGWREVAEKQMVPGKGRDTFMANREQEKDRPLSAPPQSSQFAGFSVLGYSKEQATVMMLLKYSKVYFSIPADVKWQDGDWKLVLRNDGTYSPDPTIVDSTNGFVRWGD